MIVIIAAVAKNGVIGKSNALPWRLPEDLQHFKALTLGHTVIMGRKTWESLPEKFRPLPGRENIVVTRNVDYVAPGATVAHSLAAALSKVGAGGTAFVIGGAELYAHALPLADRLELTEIDVDVEGDAFFPAFARAEWRETGRVAGRSANGLAYAFVTYERTQST
ncbi:dihydrofolate reductase [Sulfuricystis multivorans]|uniref:dihydrofolate reductase n=1 Tax=Sulfuricystis multivorans TaxID=2211108 RepID=UPI000F848246|nr:dihydrofolate reductase [Sulfuricystis multivorans]